MVYLILDHGEKKLSGASPVRKYQASTHSITMSARSCLRFKGFLDGTAPFASAVDGSCEGTDGIHPPLAPLSRLRLSVNVEIC